MLTVVVIGGYGLFGARIARALARDERVRLVIGGRDRQRAVAAARALGLAAERGVAIDAHGPGLVAQLRALEADLLVHTAGPFQGQNYDVAEAAIESRCHYVDLADARAFVTGIARLDERARARGVAVVSGASTVPALSSAVVQRYAPRFGRLAAIRIGISSGARSPGVAAVRGVFSYVGQPFLRLENGAWVTTHGWLDLRRHRFPAPLGSRWVGSCDVPDLDVLPARYPGVSTVTFHAGFASDVGHLVVYALAGLVRAGVLRNAASLAAPLTRLAQFLEPVFSHRGGMFVTLEGTGQDGAPLSLTWSLLAAQNHGPAIPCGAAIALARRLAGGRPLPVGAMPCVGLLSVDEYLEPLRELDVREVPP